jgi:hypothetical protein
VYLPGDRAEVTGKTGGATPAGKDNPMLTVVPDGCPGHDGGKDDAAQSLVRAGAVVRDGVLTERPEPAAA